MVFGHLQQAVGIGVMPAYLLVFVLMNLGMLELAYGKLARKREGADPEGQGMPPCK